MLDCESNLGRLEGQTEQRFGPRLDGWSSNECESLASLDWWSSQDEGTATGGADERAGRAWAGRTRGAGRAGAAGAGRTGAARTPGDPRPDLRA